MGVEWTAEDGWPPDTAESVALAVNREIRRAIRETGVFVAPDMPEFRKALVLSGLGSPSIDRAWLEDSAHALDYWRSTEYPYPCYAASEFCRSMRPGSEPFRPLAMWDGDPEEPGWVGRFTIGPPLGNKPKRVWVITGGPFNWSINPESGIQCGS